MTDKRHTTVEIEQTLHASTTATVDLPEGMAWEDIKEWYVQWDTLHYTTDGEAWHEIELYSVLPQGVDWKRPDMVYIVSPDEGNILEQA